MIPTKERIKEVAFSLFAEKGYEATSIADIAAGVGLTKPALYAHFGGKEDLFLSIHEDVENDYNSYMQKVFQEAGPMEVPQKLFYLFERYIKYFLKNPGGNAFWYRVMLFPPQDLKDKLARRVYENERKFSEQLGEIIREGMAQGVLRQGSVETVSSSFYSIREGLLIFMSYISLGKIKEFDEQKMSAGIRAVWEDYWLGIKGTAAEFEV
ncbi:MAG: TetR/AcrR family transcriptional regulator [Bacillota bacterium]